MSALSHAIWLIAVCLLLPGTVRGQTDDATVRVGSKRFTESYLLGEIIADRLKATMSAEHRIGLGNTAVTLAALRAGAIDCYPEYLGTIELDILKKPPARGDLNLINQDLAALGLTALAPLGFSDRYALAISQDLARTLGIQRISQLALQPQLRIGVSQEFLGRADGWPGLAARYGLPQTPRGLDHGLAYAALAAGQIDVTDVYTTDARIAKDHLQVLDDDRHYFPNYDAVILARSDLQTRNPRAWQELLLMRDSISQAQMIALNSAVEIDGRDLRQVARQFVDQGTGARPLAGSAAERKSWLGQLFAPDLGRLAFEHVRLVLLAVVAAIAVGVPLGVAASWHPLARTLILSSSGILQTIPSLALLAMLIPLMGRIGTGPALLALFLYSLLPIVRNTLVGLEAVPSGIKDAARALGLSDRQRLRLIDLPLAGRIILAGIKTATILAIGTATLAALIGAGGFGERITIGLALNDHGLLLAGAIPAALLAIAADLMFDYIDQRMQRAKQVRQQDAVKR